jgi:proline iminopeptidase
MVLHGGPGAGCTPAYFRYFNPQVYHIILHDQRGCGQSKPYAELKENTTWDLVEDIEKLRRHLNLGPVILFGGSWGSTLALAYGETYPQNVKGMILRGIFTASKQELDHYYNGGTALYFPYGAGGGTGTGKV